MKKDKIKVLTIVLLKPKKEMKIAREKINLRVNLNVIIVLR
jgi:hypothetical protein